MTTIYDETHEMFRASFRAFVESELAPRNDDWERAGIIDREVFIEAGKHGFLGMAVDETYGGGELSTFASTPSSPKFWRTAAWAELALG